MNKEKNRYYEIQDGKGNFVGYVKAENEEDAFLKVIDNFPGCSLDNYFVGEISKKDIDKEYLEKLKEQDVVEENL